MNRSNDNGLSRAEFEYLYDTDNKEPETDKSPEYESLEWLKGILCLPRISLSLPDIPYL